MNKIVPFFLLFLSSVAIAQSEPALRLFDIQAYQGEMFTRGIGLKESDWQHLNPDGFPQPTDESFKSWFSYRNRSTYGGNMKTVQVQFALRKNNPDRTGLWLAGVMVGMSSSNTFAHGYWNRTSDYYIADTVNFSSGAPSQLLVSDTSFSVGRDLTYQNAHLGLSIGYQTNPSRLFSFKVRALLDLSVSTRTSARYWGFSNLNSYMVTDTTGFSDAVHSSQETSQTNLYASESSYSTNTMFGLGVQVPVGISWQLSSFRPVLSRFSIGVEMAGGLRLLTVPGLGVYSTPTFSMGANFAYRFKTWIPDGQNIKKLRENK